MSGSGSPLLISSDSRTDGTAHFPAGRALLGAAPSTPLASELEVFHKIFDGNLTAFNVEALEALFPDGGKGSSRQPRKCKAIS